MVDFGREGLLVLLSGKTPRKGKTQICSVAGSGFSGRVFFDFDGVDPGQAPVLNL